MVDWPLTLPQQLEQQGYKETPPKKMLRTTMDAGPAKQRPRFSSNVRPIEGMQRLTFAETEILDQFFNVTLQGGSIPFNWVHPRTGAACVMRFTKEPEYGTEGAAFQAMYSLEILP